MKKVYKPYLEKSKLSYVAILLSVLSSIPDWKSLFDSTNNDIKNNTTLLLQQETLQTKQGQQTSELFDSLLIQLNNHALADKNKTKANPINDATLNNNLKREQNK